MWVVVVVVVVGEGRLLPNGVGFKGIGCTRAPPVPSAHPGSTLSAPGLLCDASLSLSETLSQRR